MTTYKINGRTSLCLLAALLPVLRASLGCRHLSTRLWFSLPALGGRGRWSWGWARHLLLCRLLLWLVSLTLHGRFGTCSSTDRHLLLGRLLLWLVTRLTLHVRFGTCSSTARHRDPFHLRSAPFDLGPTFGNDVCLFSFALLRARDSLECAHHGPTYVFAEACTPTISECFLLFDATCRGRRALHLCGKNGLLSNDIKCRLRNCPLDFLSEARFFPGCRHDWFLENVSRLLDALYTYTCFKI